MLRRNLSRVGLILAGVYFAIAAIGVVFPEKAAVAGKTCDPHELPLLKAGWSNQLYLTKDATFAVLFSTDGNAIKVLNISNGNEVVTLLTDPVLVCALKGDIESGKLIIVDTGEMQ